VTLDIVAELFDLIFGDQSVADGIKVLVARLQTPVLKVAMLNQQFFADRNHPARRFLDSISGIAIRWGKVVNAGDPFYHKLSELVDRIQHTYDGDIAVFEAANEELTGFLAEREEIEAEQARLLAEAVRAREEEMRIQREEQLLAQKAADQRLARFFTPDIPPEIEQFLHTYWRDVLQARIFASGAGQRLLRRGAAGCVGTPVDRRPQDQPGRAAAPSGCLARPPETAEHGIRRNRR
jgi:hypothetical protein